NGYVGLRDETTQQNRNGRSFDARHNLDRSIDLFSLRWLRIWRRILLRTGRTASHHPCDSARDRETLIARRAPFQFMLVRAVNPATSPRLPTTPHQASDASGVS